MAKTITLLALFSAFLLLLGCTGGPINEGVDAQGRQYRGADNPLVTIYEYSDFECPFCGQAEPTITDVIRSYQDRVRLYYRHYPLDSHPRAMPSAIAAVCAEEQLKFWQMHDKLFANQLALEDADLLRYAREIGLDEEQFSSCIAGSGARAKVRADISLGSDEGVQATPTFIIGESVVRGAQPANVFRQAIESELARAS